METKPPSPPWQSPPVYAASTESVVGRDDLPSRQYYPELPKSYATAYGIAGNQIREIPIKYQCRDPYTKLFGDVKTKNGDLVGTAVGFIHAHKDEIKKAVDILAKRHPNINKENLYIHFCQFLFLEFALFDETDLIQDGAAAVFADVKENLRNRMEKSFPNTFEQGIAFTTLGSLAWQFESWRRNIPIGSQGLGPLQIIPDLALASGREKLIAQAYRSLLSKEDLSDQKTVIRASFDPKKMFAIKAITFDLQLTALERSHLTEHLPEDETLLTNPRIVGEIKLLETAQRLVQFPEKGPEALQYAAALSLEQAITNLFMFGEVLEVEPKIEGIKVEGIPMAPTPSGYECPPSAFGNFSLSNQPKSCLSSPVTIWQNKPLPNVLDWNPFLRKGGSLLDHLTSEKHYPPEQKDHRQINLKGKAGEQKFWISVFIRWDDPNPLTHTLTVNVYLGDEKTTLSSFDFQKILTTREDPIDFLGGYLSTLRIDTTGELLKVVEDQ